MVNEPRLQPAGIAVDDRGQLIFANGFQLQDYKRFYFIQNHESRFVRAWHGHKYEAKAMLVVQGAAVIGAVKVDDWESPNADLQPTRVVLTAKQPTVFEIPPGYANGIMSLTEDAIVCVFSSSTIEESKTDDFRFPARLWNIWNVEER